MAAGVGTSANFASYAALYGAPPTSYGYPPQQFQQPQQMPMAVLPPMNAGQYPQQQFQFNPLAASAATPAFPISSASMSAAGGMGTPSRSPLYQQQQQSRGAKQQRASPSSSALQQPLTHGGYQYYPYYLVPTAGAPQSANNNNSNSQQQAQQSRAGDAPQQRDGQGTAITPRHISGTSPAQRHSPAPRRPPASQKQQRGVPAGNRHHNARHPGKKPKSRPAPQHQSHRHSISSSSSASKTSTPVMKSRGVHHSGAAGTRSGGDTGSDSVSTASSPATLPRRETQFSRRTKASGNAHHAQYGLIDPTKHKIRTPSMIAEEEEYMVFKPRRRGCCFGCNACCCGACDHPGGCCGCMNCKGCCDREYLPPTGCCSRQKTFDSDDYRRALTRRKAKCCCAVE